jgi:hypothetical protein
MLEEADGPGMTCCVGQEEKEDEIEAGEKKKEEYYSHFILFVYYNELFYQTVYHNNFRIDLLLEQKKNYDFTNEAQLHKMESK